MQISDAVDYAAYLADATGRTHGVTFDLDADGFVVLDDAGLPVTDILTKGAYIVRFRGPGQPVGIDISAADFGDTDTAIVFGPDALPDSGGEVTITVGGVSRTYVLNELTGRLTSS